MGSFSLGPLGRVSLQPEESVEFQLILSFSRTFGARFSLKFVSPGSIPDFGSSCCTRNGFGMGKRLEISQSGKFGNVGVVPEADPE